MMSQHGRHSDRITDEAALWLVRVQDPGFSAEDRKELASWLAGSAEHVREYLALGAVTLDIGALPAAPSIDEMIALAQDASVADNVVALPTSEVRSSVREPQAPASIEPGSPVSRRPRGRRRLALWTTAATVLLAVTASLLYFPKSGPAVYTTGTGEQVSFPLSDGSVVTLNAQSSLELAFTERARNLRLIRGEAFFDVAKDPERPFEVRTNRAVVRAVGTRFNVRDRGADTTVTVVEGIVDVRPQDDQKVSSDGKAEFPSSDDSLRDSPPASEPLPILPQTVRLTVGQQASVPSRSGEVAVSEIKIDKATSWRERRLVFEALPLSAVVAEFNLYNEKRIVIQDPALAEQAISGVFNADDRASFALFLAEAGLANAETRADGTVVLRRHRSR